MHALFFLSRSPKKKEKTSAAGGLVFFIVRKVRFAKGFLKFSRIVFFSQKIRLPPSRRRRHSREGLLRTDGAEQDQSDKQANNRVKGDTELRAETMPRLRKKEFAADDDGEVEMQQQQQQQRRRRRKKRQNGRQAWSSGDDLLASGKEGEGGEEEEEEEDRTMASEGADPKKRGSKKEDDPLLKTEVKGGPVPAGEVAGAPATAAKATASAVPPVMDFGREELDFTSNRDRSEKDKRRAVEELMKRRSGRQPLIQEQLSAAMQLSGKTPPPMLQLRREISKSQGDIIDVAIGVDSPAAIAAADGGGGSRRRRSHHHNQEQEQQPHRHHRQTSKSREDLTDKMREDQQMLQQMQEQKKKQQQQQQQQQQQRRQQQQQPVTPEKGNLRRSTDTLEQVHRLSIVLQWLC